MARWKDLGRFFQDVQFYYVFKNFDQKKFSLLAVLPDCNIVALDNFETLEALVARRRGLPEGSEDQEAFARLLVKMGKVSSVYGSGYSDGAGIIESMDDIKYKSPQEKADLSKIVLITKPTLTRTPGGFVYHFFSWESRTSLAVLENTLQVLMDGATTFNWNVVKYDVGIVEE